MIVNRNENEIIFRYSSLRRLVRATVCLLRFWHNCTHRNDKLIGHLTPKELDQALFRLCRMSQVESFPSEHTNLLNKKPVPRKSPTLSLRPFLDSNLCIRVGGRLQRSMLK